MSNTASIVCVDATCKPHPAPLALVFPSLEPKKLTAFYYALGLPINIESTAGKPDSYRAQCTGLSLQIVAASEPVDVGRSKLSFLVDEIEGPLNSAAR